MRARVSAEHPYKPAAPRLRHPAFMPTLLIREVIRESKTKTSPLLSHHSLYTRGAVVNELIFIKKKILLYASLFPYLSREGWHCIAGSSSELRRLVSNCLIPYRKCPLSLPPSPPNLRVHPPQNPRFVSEIMIFFFIFFFTVMRYVALRRLASSCSECVLLCAHGDI